MLKRLSRFEVLIIYDIGYVQHSREKIKVLFLLLLQRGSMLLTSNLAFSQRERIFKDTMTTAAAIDRLAHHSMILELNMPSYRLKASKRRQEVELDPSGQCSNAITLKPYLLSTSKRSNFPMRDSWLRSKLLCRESRRPLPTILIIADLNFY